MSVVILSAENMVFQKKVTIVFKGALLTCEQIMRYGISLEPVRASPEPKSKERDTLAICVLQSKSISRNAGRSMVAAAAYRSGENLTNEQDGRTHKYENRAPDIEYKAVFTSSTDGTLSGLQRSTLWNAAEAAEKRKDARTGREWVVALPHELNEQQRAELAKEFAAELVKRYQVAADVCIHKPSKDGDERNYHVHILTTTRSVSVRNDGNFTPTLGSKTALELSDTKRRALGLGRVNDEIKEIRQTWAELANKALERAGRQERIDARTNEERGIKRIPEIHQGHVVTTLERKGIKTTIGDKNRVIRSQNNLIQQYNKAVIAARKKNVDQLKERKNFLQRVNTQRAMRKSKRVPVIRQTSSALDLVVKICVLASHALVSKEARTRIVNALKTYLTQREEAKQSQPLQQKLQQVSDRKVIQTKKQGYTAERQLIEQKRRSRSQSLQQRDQRKNDNTQKITAKKRNIEVLRQKEAVQRQREEDQKAAQQAAKSYCKKISNQILYHGINIPHHRIYEGKGGEMIFRGIQRERSQPLLLCQKEEVNNVVLVVPIDQQTEHRLKQINQGEKITLNENHSVAIKLEKTKSRGRSR